MTIRPLKAGSASLKEWIQDKMNIECHDHDDAWIAEVISRTWKKKSKCQVFQL